MESFEKFLERKYKLEKSDEFFDEYLSGIGE